MLLPLALMMVLAAGWCVGLPVVVGHPYLPSSAELLSGGKGPSDPSDAPAPSRQRGPVTTTVTTTTTSSTTPPKKRRRPSDFLASMVRGAQRTLGDMVHGAIHTVAHPGRTLKGIGAAIAHPARTVDGWWALQERKMDGQDGAYKAGAMLMTVGTLAVTLGGATALAAPATVVSQASTMGEVSRAGKDSAHPNPSLPPPPSAWSRVKGFLSGGGLG